MDTVKMKSICTKDFILLEEGSVQNLDSLIHHLNGMRSMNFKRINTLVFVNTEIKNDVAWTSYRNQAEIIIAEKQVALIKWLETAILIKQGNDWKIKLLHSTPEEKKPAP